MPKNTHDEFIRRQFYVAGLGASLGDEFVRELNKSNSESRLVLMEMLPEIFERRPISAIREVKIIQLAKKIADIRGESVNRYRKEFEKVLEVLMRGEIAKTAKTIGISYSEEEQNSIIPLILAAGVVGGATIDTWFNNFKQADYSRIAGGINLGIASGLDEAGISKSLLGTKGMRYKDGSINASSNSAKMLAATVVSGVSNLARSAFTRSLKKKDYWYGSDIIEVYSAILDSRTTYLCASLSGNTYEIGVGPVPPLHNYCRSSRYPIPRVMQNPELLRVDGVDFAQNAKRRLSGSKWDSLSKAEKDAEILSEKRMWVEKNIGTMPEKMRFKDFLERQPNSFKRDYLGPTRYSAWKNGNLDIGDFVSPSGDRYTIAELYQKGVL